MYFLKQPVSYYIGCAEVSVADNYHTNADRIQ